MVQNQVLIKNIPVLKTGIFGAYYFGIVGIIFGILLGALAVLSGSINQIILISLGFPIAMIIMGFCLCALYAYGTRIGLGVANGYQIDVENEAGTVVLKKLYAMKGAILGAFQFFVVFAPISIILGLIVSFVNLTSGLIVIIGWPILALILGFVISGLRTFGTSTGLSVAGGLPIKIESANGKITLRGISAIKYGIVTSIDTFILMVFVSVILLVFALLIPDFGSQAGSLGGGSLAAIGAIKGVLLIMVIALPIAGIIFGFISGVLSGFAINVACNLLNGFSIDAVVQSTKITVQKLSLIKTGAFAMIFIIISSIFSIIFQGLIQMLGGNVIAALIGVALGIAAYIVIGGLTGLIAAISVNALNGYDIEGENLNKIVGSA